jgi:hypothetical protein
MIPLQIQIKLILTIRMIKRLVIYQIKLLIR